MYSKIILFYVLLVFGSINSQSIFDSDSEEKLHDGIPAHLRDYDFNLICKLQPNGYNCSETDKMTGKFYYDTAMKTCMTFMYGDCDFSHNKFNTLQECNANCFDSTQQDTSSITNITANMLCRLQPEFGNCHKYLPMFYFDITTRTCRGFSFSGCGGNGNKFPNEHICKNFCSDAVSIPKRATKVRTGHNHQWDIQGRRQRAAFGLG